jgi:AcrR family transcriptional regulator
MPKTVDHDEYRKELLQKCFDLFGRMGFSNVTMRQIAEEIGVSTGTLYHYFPTKVSILEQMFAWAAEQDIQVFSPQLNPDLPLAERLTRISEIYVVRGSFHQKLLLLALDLFRHSPGGSEEAFRDFVDPFKEAISKSLGTDPKLSEAISTYLLGFALHALLIPHHFSYAEHGRFMPEVLRALITGRDGHREGDNGNASQCKGRRRGRAATGARTAHRSRQPIRNRVRP